MSVYFTARRQRIVLAISAALFLGAAQADFPADFELSTLNGANGVVFNGVGSDDATGSSVSAAGDLNGDGIDDLVIGAPDADPNASRAGAVYVVFGNGEGFTSPLNLSTLNGINGFVIHGEAQFDAAGSSVSAAGDFNDDGIDDLLIGAPYVSTAEDFTGAAYVVFGSDQGFTSPFELSTLDGGNGIQINGIAQDDLTGRSVSMAGDINGDTIDDLIIGAFNANAGAGASYVVFGSDQGFPNPLELSSLNGSNGFRIDGVESGDSSGFSVDTAGDINGDTFDDVIVGAPLAGPIGANPGIAYVIFGTDQAWASSLSLSALNGSNGFALSGVATGDELGSAVAAAGDINVDGLGDVVLGAPKADPNGASSGASYVVFGSDQARPASFNLSGLNGSTGFAINGIDAGDEAGRSVSAAGKVNLDAFDDLIIGAPYADPNGESSGESYVVYGKDEAWSSLLQLSTLNGANGFTLNGVAGADESGRSVSTAGDINGDGRSDILIGAPDDSGGSSTGMGYLIFGETGANGDLIFADSFESN